MDKLGFSTGFLMPGEEATVEMLDEEDHGGIREVLDSPRFRIEMQHRGIVRAARKFSPLITPGWKPWKLLPEVDLRVLFFNPKGEKGKMSDLFLFPGCQRIVLNNLGLKGGMLFEALVLVVSKEGEVAWEITGPYGPWTPGYMQPFCRGEALARILKQQAA